MLAPSAPTPSTALYQPNAVPCIAGGARSATSAFSLPSTNAKYTPYVMNHSNSGSSDSLNAKPA